MHPLETYLRDLTDIRSTGAAVAETSFYGPLANLLNVVGQTLKPRVRCVINLRNVGAGIPDGGLFTPDQLQKGAETPLPGQLPGRGAIECKSTKEDAWRTADAGQVTEYWRRYRQVLVTNYRDFVLVGQDEGGAQPLILETFRLTDTERAFWRAAAQPHALASRLGDRFVDYLKRVMLHAAPLADPKDVAWFLASYARDAKARIEAVKLPALDNIRSAMEEALGLTFEGDKGDHFFRSTLVQTLFYGFFSAWVLWQRTGPRPSERFDLDKASRHLHVPILRKLFRELTDPVQLQEWRLDEVLTWTATVLNRVDRTTFFAKFQDVQAVQYFYEPFLEAFDPVLRKELGVWYTPPEIVRYMVARVDTVLREDLGRPDGLADDGVYVLDPCCGTGAYLVEVLRTIAGTLREQGDDAMLGAKLKAAATKRLFGFEILPAPFVVAHLQLGLFLQGEGVPLQEGRHERAGVYLTNALTGWEPPREPHQHLLFPEMEDERDRAEAVKRNTPLLVVLGNPPYNGFAGVAVDEERDLSDAYRWKRGDPPDLKPQGQGLNDLYVRFFRMAERCIVERGMKHGVVCFISNYSWLDSLSFPLMRQRFQNEFDAIWIDNLNGDKFRTGKQTPDGNPDPSIFSTEQNREGIQIGTAIALLLRKSNHTPPAAVHYRDLWGQSKRSDLLRSLPQFRCASYQGLAPARPLGLPFRPYTADKGYLSWPLLADLFLIYSQGVKTSRDLELVEIDREKLREKMESYFSDSVDEAELARLAPGLMASTANFDAIRTRSALLRLGINSGFFVLYSYRPFDNRTLYWHPQTNLLDRKRDDLFPLVQAGNYLMTCRQKGERSEEGSPFYISRLLPDYHLTRPGCTCFPITVRGWSNEIPLFQAADQSTSCILANLSNDVRAYLASIRVPNPDADDQAAGIIWMHALAIGHSALYLTENSGGLWQDWPRVPLPAGRKALVSSATLGSEVAALLDTETAVPRVTAGATRPELKLIGTPSRAGGGQINAGAGELDITARWGIAGKGGVTMPGRGRVIERDYTAEERTAIVRGAPALGLNEAAALACLGETTCDVYLNDVAFWRNVPARVWAYTLGGYQVIKKWLSYREHALLGRGLTLDEVTEVKNMARRIAALLLLGPALDANYHDVKASTYPWEKAATGKP